MRIIPKKNHEFYTHYLAKIKVFKQVYENY